MSKTITLSSQTFLQIIIFLFFPIYVHHAHSYNDSYNDTGNDAERVILLQLSYHWLGLPDYYWSSESNDYCTWSGISCINGSVTEINFSARVSFGEMNDSSIPSVICDLKNLMDIDLSWNYLVGSFPTSLCNCSKLKYLDLSRNSFTESIPVNIDKLLSPHLEHLDLSYNRFSGGIPAAFGNFTALQYLNSSRTGISGRIPHEFGKLKRLSQLDLSGNQLYGRIPTPLAALQYLSYIDLSANQLSGPIPSAMGCLSGLSHLFLSDNKFSGKIPSEIGNLSWLYILNLSDNFFSGKIPSEIGNLSALGYLDLSDNNFSGTILDDFGKLKWLSQLDMSGNQLSGRIPTQLAALPNLSYIDLRANQLSGRIPFEIGDLSTLIYLDLSVNKFSSKIPSEIGKLSYLQYLDLSDNKLSGKIPSELANLFRIENLDLSVNIFSGKLPSEIGNLLTLKYLDLSQNKFSGKIPREIGKLSELRYLDLSGNNFSGKIPHEIFLLKIHFVDLSANRLCGIPKKFKDSFPVSRFSDIYDCKSTQTLAAILSMFAVPVLLIMGFTFYVLRRYKFIEYRLDSTWKLIPFQKLEFTGPTILSSLTESNLIGCGGSRNVYKVQVNSSGKFVVVKRICIDKKMDERLGKQFLSELQILGNIRHLNILKLMCCFSSENSELLVYEYMENGSLDEWLHGKRTPSTVSSSFSPQNGVLDWPKRLKISIAIAQGLCYMHHCSSSPIIHRNLKSSNILLDSQFNAKIADFGLARILEDDGVTRTMSVVVGTLGYIAPEYAQTARANEKVDVYSFGVILLELVTGRKAHQGDENSSLAEWTWHHIQHGNPIVDALDEKIKEPNHLEEMIKVFKLGIYCTHTLPSNRPTMREVEEILHLCAHPSAPRENTLNPIALNSTVRLEISLQCGSEIIKLYF